MTSISVTVHRKDEPPIPELQAAIDAPEPTGGILLHVDEHWNAVLIEGGTESGAPSVLVWIPTSEGVVILETTFESWRTATVALAALAEHRLGYTNRET